MGSLRFKLRRAAHGLENRLSVLAVAALLLLPGLAGIAVLDVGHAPDVWTHTYRISAILNGDVVSYPVDSLSAYHCVPGEGVGGRVDDDIVQLSVDYFNGHDTGVVLADTIVARSGGASEVPFNNTAGNNPVGYLPQLAAFAVGEALGLPALAQYYLAEVVMLLVWTALGTTSVMLMPRHRLAMLACLLFPLIWFPYSFAISTDSLCLALSFLYAALLCRCMEKRPSVWDCVALAAAGLLLSLTKLPYAALFVLAFAVPIRHGGLGCKQIVLGGGVRARRCIRARMAENWSRLSDEPSYGRRCAARAA